MEIIEVKYKSDYNVKNILEDLEKISSIGHEEAAKQSTWNIIEELRKITHKIRNS